MKRFFFLMSLFLLISCNNTNQISNNTTSKSENIESSTSEILSDPYSIEELYIKKDNQKNIYGKLYTPTNDNKNNSLVILSHSAFLTGDTLKEYAIYFAKKGYYSFTFDFCGGSYSSKSDGNVKDMTIFSEVDDLKNVIDYFLKQDFIDKNNILLLGSSQGGLVSALTANDYNDKINGLILFYPAFNIPDQVKQMNNSSFFDKLIPLGEDFINTLKDYDAYEHINKFTKNVLIIHGDKDTTVPISYSLKAKEIYKNCIIKTIANANHGFNKDNYSFTKNYDSEVFSYIDSFLNTF